MFYSHIFTSVMNEAFRQVPTERYRRSEGTFVARSRDGAKLPAVGYNTCVLGYTRMTVEGKSRI